MASSESERIHTYTSNATFLNKAFQPCHFRTANCPNNCNHPTTNYTFRIDSLNVLTNPDSKQAKYCPPVEQGAEYVISETSLGGTGSSDGDAGDTAPLKDVAESLVEGDSVELHWNHDYVKRGMAFSPEYPVTKLVKL